jgi:hypothetical protein
MEPQDYESPDGYCDECLDESLIFDEEVKYVDGTRKLFYHCPGCMKIFVDDDKTTADDLPPFAIPPYDD